MDRVLTELIKFGTRHERAITIVSGAWFVISCASWIPQISIPEIPYVTDRNSWVLSGAWNTLWWGFAHPALEKKRKKMQAVGDETDSPQLSDE